MTHHDWSSDWPYFHDVSEAAYYIGSFLRKWGRVGVRQTKEKFGCVRVYLSFGWYQLHSITHPGHCFCRYPQWLWVLDCKYFSKLISLLNFIVVPYHKWLYNKAYQNAIKKWPHIRDEILIDADFPEFIEGNDELMAAHWTQYDKDGNPYPWTRRRELTD